MYSVINERNMNTYIHYYSGGRDYVTILNLIILSKLFCRLLKPSGQISSSKNTYLHLKLSKEVEERKWSFRFR